MDEDDWITSQEEKSFIFNKAAGASVFFSLYEPGCFAKNVELHTLKYLSSCSSSVFGVQPKLVSNINSAKSAGGKKKQHFSCVFQIFLNPFFFFLTFLPYIQHELTHEVHYSGVTVSCAINLTLTGRSWPLIV